ncbi:hypothetical protein [Syntrophomonas palmitatica]|uniref:hypothetical protein n=1 Tax=Syntrophomonas palmitatica TaxID=402877 RepID=UPI0006D12B25|nr:hypothetical protein [Syntrophomonas palmitatica]
MANTLESTMKNVLEDALNDKYIDTSRNVLASMTGWLSREYPDISNLIEKVMAKTDDKYHKPCRGDTVYYWLLRFYNLDYA